jgi:Domain of unknown function (DUF4286)
MEVEEEYEAELNAWYDEEHVPERLACPGFLSAHRYRLAEGSSPGQSRYLAIYELESPAVLESPEYQALVPPTKRWAALLPHVKVIRNITPRSPARCPPTSCSTPTGELWCRRYHGAPGPSPSRRRLTARVGGAWWPQVAGGLPQLSDGDSGQTPFAPTA